MFCKMWTVHMKGAAKRVDNIAVFIHGKIYSFDFQNADKPCTSRDLIDVYVFDPASYRWEIVQTQALSDDEPIGIYRHTIVAYGHCAYLWGGWDRGMSPKERFRLNTRRMEWSHPEMSGEVPESVSSHTACVMGHRMYIFADILFGDSSNRVWFVDLETMKWRHVPIKGEAPAGRCLPAISAIGTRMYLWGGCVENIFQDPRFSCDDNIYNLETTTSTWVRPQVEGDRPAGRHEHSAFVYNGELYIFGGQDLMRHICFADLHKYDPVKSCWTEVKPRGSSPCARHSHSCCVIGERVFFFNGLVPIFLCLNEPLTDLHLLQLAPTLKNLCVPAAIDAGLDLSHLPSIIRSEINAATSSES